MPSFGDWGFVLAAPQALTAQSLRDLPEDLRFLDQQVWQAAQVFGGDTGPVLVEENSIQSHALVGYYLDGWARWFE